MSSFLHSPAWERFNRRLGNPTFRQESQLYIQKKLPLHLGNYAISSRCQLSRDSLPPGSDQLCFLRYEPLDQASYENLLKTAEVKKLKLLPTTAVQPRQTIILNIQNSDEEIIQSMKQKHRYNIRLAQKQDLKVEIFSSNLTQHFSRFWDLLTDTAQRQDFRTHPEEYYRALLEELAQDQMAHLLFISNDQTTLASMLLITHESTATYLHGASSPEHRELMAAYLMHWEAIRFAKSLKLTEYDLWGIHAFYNSETKSWSWHDDHPSAGTTRLKLGFGGKVVEYPGAYDLIFNPFCYTLYKRLRDLRSRKRAFA